MSEDVEEEEVYDLSLIQIPVISDDTKLKRKRIQKVFHIEKVQKRPKLTEFEEIFGLKSVPFTDEKDLNTFHFNDTNGMKACQVDDGVEKASEATGDQSSASAVSRADSANKLSQSLERSEIMR